MMYNSHLSVDIQSSYRFLYCLRFIATEATSSRRGMAAAESCAKNFQNITVIGLYNYGEDVGNTLQYVLKSLTDAQQQRQHGQNRGQTVERR